MNKRQKEIIESQLADEKAVIARIKKLYEKALKDIDTKIKLLSMRPDFEQSLRSIVYQIDYQKALKKQINAILDMMNTEQFTTISEYLAKCYEEGFIGTLYDLQGQGIPLIFPISQDQVVKAIQQDTKLSESLYERLGMDVGELKKAIQTEVSRGIASNLSWTDIARNLSAQSGITMNKAIRIARTEGHRITQQATLDVQMKAKEKGAEIMRQWDSTLDKRTRPAHRELDGQLREMDQPFEYMGHTAMYPGGFGVAKLDINCRCVLLQRAKWALTDKEFTKRYRDEDGSQLARFESVNSYNEFKKAFFEKVGE